MSLADKAHSIRVAMRAIQRDMNGLNPNTSTYRKLKEKYDALQVEASSHGADRTDKQKS